MRVGVRLLSILALLWSVQSAAAINGYHDDANSSSTWGWVCDSSDFASALTVWVYRSSSGTLANPGAQGAQYLGSTQANLSRGDLGSVCGGNLSHAFSFSWPTSANDGLGYYIYATAVPIAGGGEQKLTASPIYTTFPAPANQLPRGGMDDLYATGQVVRTLGWTCDPDAVAQSLSVQIWASTWQMSDPLTQGATLVTTTTANLARPDVAGLCGGTTAHGYNVVLPTSLNTGTPRYIYAYAIDANNTSLRKRLDNTPLGITFPPPPNQTPAGSLDDLRAIGQAVHTTGWACDLDLPTSSLAIEIWASTWMMQDPIAQGGVMVANATASLTRQDVLSACGGTSSHGFDAVLPASLNTGVDRYVYAYAIDANTGARFRLANSPLGIRFPAASTMAVGTLDDLWADSSQQVRVAGWACDPDAFNQSLNVRIYAATWNMNDPLTQGAEQVVVGSASESRSDLGGVCGGNTSHAYTFLLPSALNTGVERYVYAYAEEAGSGALTRLSNTPLGLRFPGGKGSLWNAQEQSATLPTTMGPGEAKDISFSFKNTGNTTWTPGMVGTFSYTDNLVNKNTWGVLTYPITTNVPPGSVASFSFRIVAPVLQTSANVLFSFGMTQDISNHPFSTFQKAFGTTVSRYIQVSVPVLPQDYQLPPMIPLGGGQIYPVAPR